MIVRSITTRIATIIAIPDSSTWPSARWHWKESRFTAQPQSLGSSRSAQSFGSVVRVVVDVADVDGRLDLDDRRRGCDAHAYGDPHRVDRLQHRGVGDRETGHQVVVGV